MKPDESGTRWGEGVGKHRNGMLTFAHRVLHDRDEAEHAVRRALGRALGAISSGFRPTVLRPWVYRVVLHEVQKVEKKGKKRKAHGVRAAELRKKPKEMVAEETREMLRAVMLAEVDRLPGVYRDVLLLRFCQHMSYEDAAEALEVPEGTVNSYQAKALATLRKQVVPVLKAPGEAAGTECTVARERMADWVSDNLTPTEREETQGHIRGCISCLEELERHQVMTEVLDSFPEEDPIIEKPAEKRGGGLIPAFVIGAAAGVAIVLAVLGFLGAEEPPVVEGTLLFAAEQKTETGTTLIGQGLEYRVGRGRAVMKMGGRTVTLLKGTEFAWEGSRSVRVKEGTVHCAAGGGALTIVTRTVEIDLAGAEAWIEDGGAKNVTGVTVLSGEAALSNRSGKLKVRAGAQAGCAAGRKPRRIK
ncbi:MAG: sigma-70 family RNA polymerase sigma factor, partial [Planctomycetota bacterium]